MEKIDEELATGYIIKAKELFKEHERMSWSWFMRCMWPCDVTMLKTIVLPALENEIEVVNVLTVRKKKRLTCD
jgi:hypothetical protein